MTGRPLSDRDRAALAHPQAIPPRIFPAYVARGLVECDFTLTAKGAAALGAK